MDCFLLSRRHGQQLLDCKLVLPWARDAACSACTWPACSVLGVSLLGNRPHPKVQAGSLSRPVQCGRPLPVLLWVGAAVAAKHASCVTRDMLPNLQMQLNWNKVGGPNTLSTYFNMTANFECNHTSGNPSTRFYPATAIGEPIPHMSQAPLRACLAHIRAAEGQFLEWLTAMVAQRHQFAACPQAAVSQPDSQSPCLP